MTLEQILWDIQSLDITSHDLIRSLQNTVCQQPSELIIGRAIVHLLLIAQLYEIDHRKAVMEYLKTLGY